MMQKPIVLVFAGPNGSGKSTVKRSLKSFGVYVNADDLKEEYGLTDLEAAQKAEDLRNSLLKRGLDFSFETVLSTERNLLLLEMAKAHGYSIQCIYILTCNENINVARVKARHLAGGHDVPEDKIRTRYHRALTLLPRLFSICDSLLVYDNSEMPSLIYSKDASHSEVLPNQFWSSLEIKELLGI